MTYREAFLRKKEGARFFISSKFGKTSERKDSHYRYL